MTIPEHFRLDHRGGGYSDYGTVVVAARNGHPLRLAVMPGTRLIQEWGLGYDVHRIASYRLMLANGRIVEVPAGGVLALVDRHPTIAPALDAVDPFADLDIYGEATS